MKSTMGSSLEAAEAQNGPRDWRLKRVATCIAALCVVASQGSERVHATIVGFGSGPNSFSMEFVPIGDPGNAADTTGSPNPAGSVSYNYQMGKFEVSRDMVAKANAGGSLGITLQDMTAFGGNGVNRPATGVSWNEAARFVNWLNVSQGYSPAYKFTTQPGDVGYSANASNVLWVSGDLGFNAANPFRNSQAHYFLPNTDEWYKAAYFNPTSGTYVDFATGSDSAPTAVTSGTATGTAVYSQASAQGPADIMLAGGLSLYGTMGQSGNALEWEESEADLVNDSPLALRGYRGGNWLNIASLLRSTSRSINGTPTLEDFRFGFRVASSAVSVPEASPALAGVLLTVGAVTLRRRQRLRLSLKQYLHGLHAVRLVPKSIRKQLIALTVIAPMLAVLLTLAQGKAAVIADARADFSPNVTNPNTTNASGTWSYGYTTTLGGAFVPFAGYSTNSTYFSWNGNSGFPIFGKVVVPVAGLSAGDTFMHGGPGGEKAVLRFTAHVDGVYNLTAPWKPGDSGDADLFLLLNGNAAAPLASTPSTNVAGSLAVNSLHLHVNDIVDLSLGTLGDYFNDTTGANLVIETIPEPNGIVLAGVAGAVSIVCKRRCKKLLGRRRLSCGHSAFLCVLSLHLLVDCSQAQIAGSGSIAGHFFETQPTQLSSEIIATWEYPPVGEAWRVPTASGAGTNAYSWGLRSTEVYSLDGVETPLEQIDELGLTEEDLQARVTELVAPSSNRLRFDGVEFVNQPRGETFVGGRLSYVNGIAVIGTDVDAVGLIIDSSSVTAEFTQQLSLPIGIRTTLNVYDDNGLIDNEASADFIYFIDHPEFGSFRVYEDEGTDVEILLEFNSLDLAGFGAVGNPAVGFVSPSVQVAEPTSLGMAWFVGLGWLTRIRRKRVY